jgi:hypothetical protein
MYRYTIKFTTCFSLLVIIRSKSHSNHTVHNTLYLHYLITHVRHIICVLFTVVMRNGSVCCREPELPDVLLFTSPSLYQSRT